MTTIWIGQPPLRKKTKQSQEKGDNEMQMLKENRRKRKVVEEECSFTENKNLQLASSVVALLCLQ